MPKTPGTTFRFTRQFIAVLKAAAAIDGLTMTAWARDAMTSKLHAKPQWYAVPLEMLRGTGKDETIEEAQNEA